MQSLVSSLFIEVVAGLLPVLWSAWCWPLPTPGPSLVYLLQGSQCQVYWSTHQDVLYTPANTIHSPPPSIINDLPRYRFFSLRAEHQTSSRQETLRLQERRKGTQSSGTFGYWRPGPKTWSQDPRIRACLLSSHCYNHSKCIFHSWFMQWTPLAGSSLPAASAYRPPLPRWMLIFFDQVFAEGRAYTICMMRNTHRDHVHSAPRTAARTHKPRRHDTGTPSRVSTTIRANTVRDTFQELIGRHDGDTDARVDNKCWNGRPPAGSAFLVAHKFF